MVDARCLPVVIGALASVRPERLAECVCSRTSGTAESDDDGARFDGLLDRFVGGRHGFLRFACSREIAEAQMVRMCSGMRAL